MFTLAEACEWLSSKGFVATPKQLVAAAAEGVMTICAGAIEGSYQSFARPMTSEEFAESIKCLEVAGIDSPHATANSTYIFGQRAYKRGELVQVTAEACLQFIAAGDAHVVAGGVEKIERIFREIGFDPVSAVILDVKAFRILADELRRFEAWFKRQLELDAKYGPAEGFKKADLLYEVSKEIRDLPAAWPDLIPERLARGLSLLDAAGLEIQGAEARQQTVRDRWASWTLSERYIAIARADDALREADFMARQEYLYHWENLEYDALTWWLLPSVTAEQAAILLHGKNPNDCTREEAGKLGVGPTNDSRSTTPSDFRRLLSAFESLERSQPLGQLRTLEDWLHEAETRGLHSHYWLREWLAAREFMEAQRGSEREAIPDIKLWGSRTMAGLGRKEILAPDWPLISPYTQKMLGRAMSDVPNHPWILNARKLPGKKGAQGSARWSPAQLGACLVAKNKANKLRMDAFIRQTFKEWVGEWESVSEHL